jgi:hypothetical protein
MATKSTWSPSSGLWGRPFGQILQAYRKCCPIGLIGQDGQTVLNPPMERVISPGDRIVLIAEDDSKIKAIRSSNLNLMTLRSCTPRGAGTHRKKTLILGWNGRATRIIEQTRHLCRRRLDG